MPLTPPIKVICMPRRKNSLRMEERGIPIDQSVNRSRLFSTRLMVIAPRMVKQAMARVKLRMR